jgi:hypothetical protein
MTKSVILDSGLLVLFIVGGANPKYIKQHKKCSGFDENDHGILTSMMLAASSIVVTPHVLSEASNHLEQAGALTGTARREIMFAFRSFILNNGEHAASSMSAARRDEFVALGLSDSALIEIQNDNSVLLTTDIRLCNASMALGFSVIHFPANV